MARRSTKNNTIAGLFVLSSIALLVIAIVVIGGASTWFESGRSYTVRFALSDGVGGLTPGSDVTVGGFAVGQVQGLRLVTGEEPGLTFVDVRINITSDITLYENAIAHLNAPIIGVGGAINIVYVGDPQGVASPRGGSPELASDEPLPGAVGPPPFVDPALARLGFEDEQREQVRTILANTVDVTDRVAAAVRDDWPNIRRQALEGMTNFNELTSETRASWSEWEQRVDNVLANAERASEQFDAVISDARDAMEEYRLAAAEARQILAENREPAREGVEAFRDLASRLNEETYDSLMRALEEGEATLVAARESAEEVRGMVRQERPDIERTIANARLAADQLKLTLTEVRAAPWKLLSQPKGKRALETELLSDSVRAYASAVSDLRSASEALEAATSNPDAAEAEREADRAARAVADALERYVEVEQRFLDELIRLAGE